MPCASVIFADFGMSTFALDDPTRGFSFRFDGPLDMRMDQRQELRASDIVNEESEEELARIIFAYGEDRASRQDCPRPGRGALAPPARNDRRLAGGNRRSARWGSRGKISPATRTFQALRIAVNHELESLARFSRKRRSGLSRADESSRSRIIRSRTVRSSAPFGSWPKRGTSTRLRTRPYGPSAKKRSRIRARAAHDCAVSNGDPCDRRPKPIVRPSRLIPALLAIAIVAAGFTTLMVRLEVTQEGYRLSALRLDIRNLEDRTSG